MEKNKKIRPTSLILLKIVVWILGMIAVYWLILKITGHSPTSEAVMLIVLSILTTLVSLVISMMFKMNREMGEVRRDMRYMKVDMKRMNGMLYAIMKDFREFKNHTH